MNTTTPRTITETIRVTEITAGDRISVNGPDERFAFEVKSIRDGMRSGIGFRTTEGEYVKLPFDHTVTRFLATAPAARPYHGFRGDLDSDEPAFCLCGAGFWEGYNLGEVKRAHLRAHGIDIDSAPAVGEIVAFREDTPQHAANRTIRFRVIPAPNGARFGLDNTHPEDLGRVYVWLEDVRDADKPPSRRRVRTGLARSLQPAPRPLLEVLEEHVAKINAQRAATRQAASR